MTSPYLERPRRELGQALKDCGINRSDFGFHPQHAKSHSHPTTSPWTRTGITEKTCLRSSKWIIAAFTILIASAAVLVATTTPGQQVAQEPNADDVINIAPAAGGPQ
jgi:hypothetical protein